MQKYVCLFLCSDLIICIYAAKCYLTMIYSCCCSDFIFYFYRMPVYIYRLYHAILLHLNSPMRMQVKRNISLDLLRLYNFTQSQPWSAELQKQFNLLNYSHGNRKIEESKWPHQGSNPGYQAQQAGFLSIRPRRHGFPDEFKCTNTKIYKNYRTQFLTKEQIFTKFEQQKQHKY